MPVPPDSYVARMHAQVSTPHSVLADLVRRTAGAPITRVERIVEGYDNEVYRIRCVDGQDVVIRISRFGGDLARTTGEAHAIDRARSFGVPAPEILLVDTVRIVDSAFPVMVQRAVPGRPIGEVLDQLSPAEREQVLVEIGGLIARLHEIPVDTDREWRAAVQREIADRRGQRSEIIAGGFSDTEFEQMMALLGDYADMRPHHQLVFCHGDLSPKHIFVRPSDEGVRVSGIIDFGDWKIDAAVHDLAVLRVRGPSLDLPSLLSGCGALVEGDFHRRLDLHTLNIALSSLWIGVDEGDQACIRRSADLISALLVRLDT